MTVAVEILAEIALDAIGIVVANDSARSSFTVASGDRLLALDGDLRVIGRWPGGSLGRGRHATWPARGLALISAADQVRMLDHKGRVRWRYRRNDGWPAT